MTKVRDQGPGGLATVHTSDQRTSAGSRRSIKSGQALKRGWVVALVMSLMMGLGLSGVVSAPAIAATTQDGLAITLDPSPLPVRKVATDPGMTLKVTDTNSTQTFTTYTLAGVPAGWQVLLNGTPLTAVSPQPLLYSIPKADALAGKVTIVPPIGFSGAPELSLTRVMATSNLIKDFDNGTFNYDGLSREAATAAPVLPTTNTAYKWDDPRLLSTFLNDYQQTGPYDGYYSIWPTAHLLTTKQFSASVGTADGFNNKWADIRSVTSPMTTTAYSSSAACSTDYLDTRYNPAVARMGTGNPVSDATAAASGKFLIVNGSMDMPVPNNLVYTTITGLNTNTWYTFSGYTANLSYDTKFTNPVQP